MGKSVKNRSVKIEDMAIARKIGAFIRNKIIKQTNKKVTIIFSF
jgi:hypothetical protein